METVKDILNRIKTHTDLEQENNVTNRSIGRGRVVMNANNKEQEIWVTMAKYQSSYYNNFTEDGRFRGDAKPNMHTLTSDGTTTWRNSAWGRILLEGSTGPQTVMTPRGAMKFEQLNSAHYTNYGNEVKDLVVGNKNMAKYLHFPTLQDAYRKYVSIMDKHEENEARKREEQRKIEEQRKAEEEARIAAQKAKDEEERRKAEEERRKAEEARILHEQEIAKLEEENRQHEEEAKEFEDTYKFIRTQASLRFNPVLDKSQNAIKFGHVYDGIASIINGGPGTGKSTTLIQRLKLLIDSDDLQDYKLNHEDSTLTDEKIAIVSARNSWIFFSPTELLCKYLKSDMSYEGLTQYEDKTYVWNDYLRKVLVRDEYKIAGTGKRFTYTNKFGEEGLFINDPMQVVADFNDYYLETLKQRLLKVSSIDYSKYTWKVPGKRIIETCAEAAHVTDFTGMVRLLFRLSDMKSLEFPGYPNGVREIVSTYEHKVNTITNNYVNDWKKDEDFWDELLDYEEDLLDSDEYIPQDEDDLDGGIDNEDNVEDVYLELLKDLKRVIRRMASTPEGTNISKDWPYYNLYKFVEDKINTDDLKELAGAAIFNREVYPCMSNYESFLMNNDFFSNTYIAFRQKMAEEQNANWNQEVLGKIVSVSTKNYLHHDECCLLVGFINNLMIKLANINATRFDNMKSLFPEVYKKICRPVIGVDEATDYSLIDYYAINSLRHYKVSSITLSGDMMQSLLASGISDWKQLQHPLLFNKIDVQSLKVSYRQGPKLIKLAHYLYNNVTGKRAPYSCYLKNEKRTPDPLWHESSDNEEKAEWMVSRVLEVQAAYKKVPSIAIFVNTDKEAAELEKAMKEDERLENAGIDVKNCTFNDELEKQDSVRIFLLNKVKGMEFEVVFFHNIDKVDQNDLIDRYLYVGLSRATFYMAVTSNPIKDEKLEDLSEQFKKEGKWKVRKR